MKKKFFPLLILLTTFLCVGCNNPFASPKSYTCIIGQNRSNSNCIDFDSEIIRRTLYDTAYTNGNISCISVESKPTLYINEKVPDYPSIGLAKSRKTTITNQYLDTLISNIKAYNVNTPEADLLGAIDIAAQQMAAYDRVQKYMLIIDSGYSTSGYANLLTDLDLWVNHPDETLELLAKNYAIPNLEGVTVIWAGFGSVAYPQNQPSNEVREKVKILWTKILEQAGANVSFIASPYTNEPVKGLPYVSIIDSGTRYLSSSTSATATDDKDNLDDINYEELINSPDGLTLETKLCFKPDSSELLIGEEQLLEGLCNYLIEHPTKIVVMGTTARVEDTYANNLSYDRALSICEYLSAKGVSEDLLLPIGLGWDNTWYVNDINPDGTQNSNARQNRAAHIYSIENEYLKEVLDYEKIKNY